MAPSLQPRRALGGETAAAAPIVTKLYEWYSTGNYFLVEMAELATGNGLKFGRSRNLAATVHNLFKNPIYYGDFLFTGKMHRGIHIPLVTKELWDRVKEVRKDRGSFVRTSNPRLQVILWPRVLSF